MERIKVFADFHNADSHGRLRLNCVGTLQDLARQQVSLHDGKQMTVYSEDLEADGVVRYSSEESLWVAEIDWSAIRRLSEEPEPAFSANQPTGQRKTA